MAVRLRVDADVRGQAQVNQLNNSIQRLGRGATGAASRMTRLEAAAARGRASFSALATTLNVAVVGGLAAVGFGINRFVRDTFAAGNLIEGLEIRFNLLFGSVEEGARAFDTLNAFAARVPFSLEDIAAASGNLAVVSDDADDLARVLEITGNVAAATGLDFRQTAEQIQRSFAGGIASADVFRERGVRAMLGFQAGVTVSVEETIQRFNEVFGPGGTFGTANEQLAQTLQGQVSLVQDAYFQFRRIVSEQFFDALTQQIRTLVGDFQTNGAELERIATRVGEGIGNALRNIDEAARFVVRNIDNFRIAISALIALRVIRLFQGWAAAITVFATATAGATTSMVALNTAIRANPFGIIVTAVTAGVSAIVLFRNEIEGLIGAVDRLIRQQNSLAAQADAAEARAAVEADIADNVRRAVEAYDEQQLRLQNNNRAAERFRDTVRSAEESFGSLNDLLIIHETRTQNILDFKHAELGIIRDAEEAERRRDELEERRLRSTTLRNDLNRRAQEQINAAIQTEADRVQRVNNLINEQANIRRRNFQEAVRLGEVAERARRDIEAANNQDAARTRGLTPEFTQEQIQAILEQEMAWERVLDVVDEIGETIADSLIEGIRSGRSAFDILREAGVRAINDIARQVLSSGISDILGRGVQAATGGAGGGFLNTIFGGARRVFGFNQGGIVPGGAPYTDRVPALLTPGERVIPRNQVNNNSSATNITNINISGNVDQRSIDQIRSVIASSSAEVGSANRQFTGNTRGLRGRNR